MVTEWDDLTQEQCDIYELLESLRRMSPCKDKQVAAIATTPMGKIISVSYNTPTEFCDQCSAEAHPFRCAEHAEQGLTLQPQALVYLTTFPCENCQLIMWSAGVRDVFVFGKQHKQDSGLLNIVLLPSIADILIAYNGVDKQRTVVMGELAELITAIADDTRKDVKENRNTLDELIDVELQIHCLRRCLGPTYLSKMKLVKYNKLIRKFDREVTE